MRARAAASSLFAALIARRRSVGSIAFRASSWARRVASSAARLCDNGLAKFTIAALLSVASRRESSPLGCERFTVDPGSTLMIPGLCMARAAASAASARSIVPIGVAARSKRSSTLADPADVTEEDPTAPAPAPAPAPGGVPGGADGVPVGGASNSSAEGASAGGGGCTEG